MLDFTLISIAAFFAGVLNAMAGGGSFLTLPALLYIGVPPIIANATSTVAVFPGYISSSFAFRQTVKSYPQSALKQLLFLAVVGGVAGSLLLLVTPNQTFRAIIPWLLLFATLVFAFGKSLTRYLASRNVQHRQKSFWNLTSFAVLLVSIYGGYFNGGLGIILLALFSFMGLRDINQMNGLKSYLSAILSSVSVLTFTIAGIIYWQAALLMMVCATAGGFVGAKLALRVPERAIRWLVVLTGLIMSMVFFMRT